MWQGATSFNQPLDSWDTSSVTTLQQTFQVRAPLRPDSGCIPDHTSSHPARPGVVRPYRGISPFGSTIHTTCWQGASKFDQPLGSWNTSSVKSLVWTFQVRAPILLALAAARITCPLSPELQQSSHPGIT